MKFRHDDQLLAMDVVRPGTFVVTVTDGGYAKRTSVDEYRIQGRGGLGIRVAKLPDDRGHLVGAAVVEETDELLVVMERGRVVRSKVSEVPPKGRTTMGVTFAKPDKGDRILLVTTGPESEIDEEEAEKPVLAEGDAGVDAGADAGGDDVEIRDAEASAPASDQDDALGSDESEPSTDDADHDEE
jgi:DNA gyrase subunit A